MKKLVILTGPTAVGKSALSIQLAKRIRGEIISADSMQVYKGMDIGSAKISKDEMDGVPHHLIDILSPTDDFDITLFKNLAYKAMEEIYLRGNIPIVCGGTGFYIQALLYNIDFTEEDSIEKKLIREQLNLYLNEHGSEALHDLLKEIDPVSYELIPSNNTKRVIRAIEFYKLNNSPISQHNEEQRNKESDFNFAYFVLNDDRNVLYSRIDQRVDKMIDEGLVEEVKALKLLGVKKNNTSYNGIGYREIFDYLNNDCELDFAIDKIKQNSRHYAKRQLTWFRRERDVTWINRQDYLNENQILEIMIEELKKRDIYE